LKIHLPIHKRIDEENTLPSRTTRTAEKDKIFMSELAQTGSARRAARTSGYGRTQLYLRRQTDAAFAEAWDDAVSTYVEALEAEADRRAVEGVVKPVFYLGEQCGEVRQYSDTLLIFRLKALRPEMYRDIPKTPAPTPPAEGERKTYAETLQRIKRDVYGIVEHNEC
jgi:hypothetical protein